MEKDLPLWPLLVGLQDSTKGLLYWFHLCRGVRDPPPTRLLGWWPIMLKDRILMVKQFLAWQPSGQVTCNTSLRLLLDWIGSWTGPKNVKNTKILKIKSFHTTKCKAYCHVVSHWEDRNKIFTTLAFELTVASRQRMTVKNRCLYSVTSLGSPDMGRKKVEAKWLAGTLKTEVAPSSRQRKKE